MSGKQTFERLISLEDEELGGNDDHSTSVDYLPDKESCKVPMIPAEPRLADNLFTKFKPQSRSNNSLGSGINFNFNGRRIQINPEQLKYISLLTLTIQNAALNLTMRAARTQPEEFSSSVAVTVAEFLKLVTCVFLIWYDDCSIVGTFKTIKSHVIENYIDTLKVAIPSFIYYVQNNLLYVGSSHLDAATNQITYQLKILTTAIFSVFMLNKKLSKLQWASLVVLFIGVALIETIVVSEHADKSATNSNDTSSHHKTAVPERRVEEPIVGLLAVLTACCLSGFAGVYFEKILKNTSHVSLWIRNIQLAMVAIPFGLFQVLFTEYNHIVTKGAFHGFTPLTWLCILLQVQGGLLVAVVVKFANNILKGFATSMAIVISTVASIFLFDFNLTPAFLFGASLVIASVMMYNKQ